MGEQCMRCSGPYLLRGLHCQKEYEYFDIGSGFVSRFRNGLESEASCLNYMTSLARVLLTLFRQFFDMARVVYC